MCTTSQSLRQKIAISNIEGFFLKVSSVCHHLSIFSEKILKKKMDLRRSEGNERGNIGGQMRAICTQYFMLFMIFVILATFPFKPKTHTPLSLLPDFKLCIDS